MTSAWERSLVGLGAAAGLAGVAMSAAAAHIEGGGSLDVAARFCLVHAPVLLALAALIVQGAVGPRTGRLAGSAIAAGLVLFCGDLSVRATLGIAPVPMAAPAGGIVLMLGWALLGLAAVLPRGATGRPTRT